MKKKTNKKIVQSNLNRDPAITMYSKSSSSCRVHCIVAMTACEKCCSNIVCTLLSWCARGLHGNQDGITWLWRTIRANQWDNVERQEKQKDSDQNHKSCFLSLLFLLCQKNVCFAFAWLFFFLSVPCLPWSYCLCKSGWLLSVLWDVQRGENTKSLVALFTALTNF